MRPASTSESSDTFTSEQEEEQNPLLLYQRDPFNLSDRIVSECHLRRLRKEKRHGLVDFYSDQNELINEFLKPIAWEHPNIEDEMKSVLFGKSP